MQAPTYDVEQRFLLSVMTLCVLVLLGAPALDLVFGLDTWSYRLTLTTSFPRIIGLCYGTTIGLILPVTYCIRQRWAMRLACLGACLGSFTCYGMAYLSRNMDIGNVITQFLSGFSFYYLVAGTVSLVYAGTLAILLNAQMMFSLVTGLPVEELTKEQ